MSRLLGLNAQWSNTLKKLLDCRRGGMGCRRGFGNPYDAVSLVNKGLQGFVVGVV